MQPETLATKTFWSLILKINLKLKTLVKNFKGNENFIKIVESSTFCSEDNKIINDSFKITKDQKIGIIPPIGGG